VNAANRIRLDAWRDRYHAATGKYPDVIAHITQRQRGIAWDRVQRGYLPVRTVYEIHAQMMSEAGLKRAEA
jgi:hypothetical protein